MTVNRKSMTAQVVGMFAVYALVLFLPAGTLAWAGAWAFLAMMFGFTTGITLWLLRFDPNLLAERMTGIGKRGQKTWDKILLGITAVAFVSWLALMGFDKRCHWSRVSSWFQGFGALLLLCSFYFFYLVFRE